jgi:hypothetical protein
MAKHTKYLRSFFGVPQNWILDAVGSLDRGMICFTFNFGLTGVVLKVGVGSRCGGSSETRAGIDLGGISDTWDQAIYNGGRYL